MTKPVSLQAVVNELDVPTDEWTAYINRRTGELFTITEDQRLVVESAEDDDFVPEWLIPMVRKVREVLNSDDFMALPRYSRRDERHLIEKFCYSIKDPEIRESLVYTIHGEEAVSRFKDRLYEYDIQEDWDRFRNAALKDTAAYFLETQRIPFI